jgi:hypothetical protein
MGVIDRTFRLTNEPGGLGLSCTHLGLTLAGVPLLHKSEAGFALRSPDEIEALVKAAYGVKAAPFELLRGFDAVARALNRGDLALAMTAAVMTRLPELDWNAAARLAKAEQSLRKQYNPDEPRDWHGCWTDDDGADASGQDKTPQYPVDFGSEANENAVTLQAAAGGIQDNQDHEPDDRPPLERKYDDLGPVAFAKEVIQFGDQLGRRGKDLTPEERKAARAEYDFLQGRIAWWQSYSDKPFEAEVNLLSASLILFQGGQLSEIASVKEIPWSMIPVATGAMVLDGTQPSFPVRGAPARSSLEGEYVPYEGEFVPYKLGSVVDNTEVGIDWNGGILGQGDPWERYVQQKYLSTQKLVPTSKAFDHFDDYFGDAISSKTLNTVTYNRIMNPESIYGKLREYVDAAANYAERPGSSIDVEASRIRTKAIQLAVPEETSVEQWQYISRAIEYGRRKGVSVMVTRIKSTSRSGRN